MTIITRKYALALVAAGKGRIEGYVWDENLVPTHIILCRPSLQRDDHYVVTNADASLIRRIEIDERMAY
jgi:hypothetical protein